MRHTSTTSTVVLLVAALAGCTPASPSLGDTATAEPTPRAAPSLVAADSQFIYQSGPGFEAGGDLFVMRGDGTGRSRLDIDLPRIRISHSDWAPDGAHISFGVDNHDNCREIWIARADGVTDRRVVVACDGSSEAGSDYSAWAPDGRSLSYTSFGPSDPESGIPLSSSITVLDLMTGATRVVAASEPGELIDYARWSPDGASLVVEIDRFADGAPTGSAVAVVSSSGGIPTRLTDMEVRAGYPDWSPDGKLLTYATNMSAFFPEDTGASNIFTMKPDGTETTQLTHFELGGDRATQPSWLRDGTGVVFTWEVGQSQSAAVISREGGEPLRISEAGAAHVRQRP